MQKSPDLSALPYRLTLRQGLIRLGLSSTELHRIASEYAQEEYSFITAPPGHSAWANRLGELYFTRLRQWVPTLSGKRVLEIGAGTLYIADRAVHELDAEHYVACDPSLRSPRSIDRVDVVRDYFSAELFAGESFDLIISLNTLEHVLAPADHLRDARALLRERAGLLYLVVPDCRRGLECGDLGICLHEHLSYFTVETLTGTLANAGFRVVWLHVEEDTLFVLAQPMRQDHAAPPAAADREPGRELRQFKARVDANVKHAADLLTRCRERGDTGLHGCSVGLCNLLFRLGVRTDPALHLFDGDASKRGMYLPGFAGAIHGASDPAYQQMESVVIGALTYYESIASFLTRVHGFDSNRIYPLYPVEE